MAIGNFSPYPIISIRHSQEMTPAEAGRAKKTEPITTCRGWGHFLALGGRNDRVNQNFNPPFVKM